MEINKKTGSPALDRRQFFGRVLPVCAMMCIGGASSLAANPAADKKPVEKGQHKFDTELERKLTYRQFFTIRYKEYIQFVKMLEKDIGKDKLIELIKKYTAERMLEYGKNQAFLAPDNSLVSYIAQFKSSQDYKNTITRIVLEETEKVYEVKIAECIWARIFRDLGAGDIGYATICHGDHAWSKGFNPKIKLLRDKTLMQGHDHCNHRYVLNPVQV